MRVKAELSRVMNTSWPLCIYVDDLCICVHDFLNVNAVVTFAINILVFILCCCLYFDMSTLNHAKHARKSCHVVEIDHVHPLLLFLWQVKSGNLAVSVPHTAYKQSLKQTLERFQEVLSRNRPRPNCHGN